MTSRRASEPENIRRSRTFRSEAARRRPGANRDALLRLADALETTADVGQLPNGVVSAGLRAFGSDDDYLEANYPLYEPAEPEPHHIRMPPVFRREAARRRPGANRDALLRLADALEAAGEDGRLPKGVLSAGLRAFGSDDDRLTDGDTQPLADLETTAPGARRGGGSSKQPHAGDPAHIPLPPMLRRSAAYRTAGPNRDAILRLADEIEAAGDASLVSRTTLRAGLRAFGTDDDPAQAGPDSGGGNRD